MTIKPGLPRLLREDGNKPCRKCNETHDCQRVERAEPTEEAVDREGSEIEGQRADDVSVANDAMKSGSPGDLHDRQASPKSN